MPTYAIGDIHGCNNTFQALLAQLPLQPGDDLILLGDLIDRGPDSKGVVDTVFRLREYGHAVHCLRGNHEQLLLNALDNPDTQDPWLINGGRQALESFGVTAPNAIPEAYRDFFSSMLLWYESDGFLCIHGGLNFTLENPLEDSASLLWLRRWYDSVDYNWLAGRIILHGHTPVDMDIILQQHRRLGQLQYLNLDNGCVYANSNIDREGLGRLVAFCLDSRELFWQENLD